jgi:hypothetical protein
MDIYPTSYGGMISQLNRRWARSEGNGRLLLSVEELGAPYGMVIDSLTWDLR